MKAILTFVFWSLSTVALFGQEIDLTDGQTLFTIETAEQRVQTADLEIVVSFDDWQGQPVYRIELVDLQRGIRKGTSFEQDPVQPTLVALNIGYRCNERIIFLTLRYPPPRNADIRAYFFQTHAFHSKTLEYLDTAPVAYEDIALQEVGVDFGWPYSAPQPYQVVCATSSKGFRLDFVLKAEIPN